MTLEIMLGEGRRAQDAILRNGTVAAIAAKKCVLFRETHSGGVLMDLLADQFFVLSPFSTGVWSRLSAGASSNELIEFVAGALHTTPNEAAKTLARQLHAWKRAGLLDTTDAGPIHLPNLKATGDPATREPTPSDIRAASLSMILAGHLAYAERQYRRRLRRNGLANALNRLPPAAEVAQPCAVTRVLRAYFALRRAFRQGDDAHDCLPRSLALTDALRRHGLDVDLCIGVSDLPFLSHAWVEQHDHVLNDRAAIVAGYAVIGRF